MYNDKKTVNSIIFCLQFVYYFAHFYVYVINGISPKKKNLF